MKLLLLLLLLSRSLVHHTTTRKSEVLRGSIGMADGSRRSRAAAAAADAPLTVARLPNPTSL